MKTKTYLFSLLILFIVLISMFQSCKKENDSVADNATLIPETTKIISDETWQNTISSIDTNNYTFVFNSNPGIETGDIMVSSMDGGYLRKVSSITQDNGKIIVKTDFTSITNAIEQVQTEYETDLTIDTKKLSSAFLAKGVSIDRDKLKSSKNTNLTINIDLIIYDEDGDFSTTNDQVKLNGDFGMTTTFNTKIKIHHFDLKELSFTYNISKQENLAATCGIALAAKEKTIAKIPFHDIIIPAGIPITIRPVLEIVAGANLNVDTHLDMGISENVNYVTTVAYSEGNWTTQKEINKSFNYNDPTLTSGLTATVYIKPKLLFKVYRTLSPKVEAQLYGAIEATYRNIDWELSAGFKAGVGVEMKIWKKSLLDFTLNLFDIKKILANGTIGGETPLSNFTAIPTSGTVPLTVNFTDQSTNNPTSWQWSFGDGSTSTQQNPQHTYYDAGTYTVTLTTTNNYGSDTKEKVNYITVTSGGEGPVAAFTATPTNGTAPLTVNFTDQSTNSPTSWQWDFGDGGNSTVQNPSHIYNSTGTYTVTLTVSNSYGSDSEVKTGYITVTDGGGTNTFTDPRDGQVYNIITIGNQTWFAENLNYETTNSWWYDNDPANGEVYGRLYTWEDALNACPDGWHLPSDDEWKQLEMFLGMSQSEADGTGWRGTDEGEKMKSTSGWNNNGNGTNSSGFNALPGGYRVSSDFDNLRIRGYWWSSNERSDGRAWARSLDYSSNQVYRNDDPKRYGFSVRCIKN